MNESKDVDLGSSALGVWDDGKKLAYVIRFRGKRINKMGFTFENKYWLLPEETTFLVTNGELSLVAGTEQNTLIDPSQAFILCFSGLDYHNVSLSEYNIFMTLVKQRHIVFRLGLWNKKEWLLTGSNQESLEAANRSGRVKLLYSVYLPRKVFKKTEPGVADFCVCISSPMGVIPPLSELRKVKETANLPLRLAHFDGQDVAFLSMMPFQTECLNKVISPKKKQKTDSDS